MKTKKINNRRISALFNYIYNTNPESVILFLKEKNYDIVVNEKTIKKPEFLILNKDKFKSYFINWFENNIENSNEIKDMLIKCHPDSKVFKDIYEKYKNATGDTEIGDKSNVQINSQKEITNIDLLKSNNSNNNSNSKTTEFYNKYLPALMFTFYSLAVLTLSINLIKLYNKQ